MQGITKLWSKHSHEQDAAPIQDKDNVHYGYDYLVAYYSMPLAGHFMFISSNLHNKRILAI